MKLHRNLALGILSGLERTLVEAYPASDTLKQLLKSNPGWGSRDRRIIAQIFYDIVRQKRFFHALSGSENTSLNLWKMIGYWMIINDFTLPDWEEFKNLQSEEIRQKAVVLLGERKYKYSIPDWLDAMGLEAFGTSTWEKEIAALNTPAELVVRVNTQKIGVEKLKDLLKNKYDITTRELADYPQALVFEKNQSLQLIKEYREGFFEVQDANSQMIAPWLNASAGKYYIDACAGAGGKSLHLANLTKDAARIAALDVYPVKLDALRRRCYRNDIQSVQTVLVEKKEDLSAVRGNADGVLIDAPCSGLGVLKRNPDAKWNMNPKRIDEIIETQKKILQTYAPFIKKGGILVYATCSIFPQENQHQIIDFLETETGRFFELEKEQTYFSHQTGFDGFYCARLLRKM